MRVFSLLILICTANICFSQKLPIKKYDQFFKEPRTSTFVHIDKTGYLEKEKLYYQAYLINNQTHFLNTKVKNVVVEVYNATGERILKQLKLARSGIIHGDFKIDSTFESKHYFMKLRIKKDEQFPYQQSHISKFEMLNENEKATNKNTKGKIKVVAEGGRFIYGVPNNISIRYIKPDKLIKEFEAVLYENNQAIGTIKSNQFGLARYKFTPNQGKEYKLKFKYLTEDIPDKKLNISNNGAIININKLGDDYVLNISGRLKKIPIQDDIKLMIHQAGKRFFVPLNINSKQFSKKFKLLNGKLFKGINTVSLFNNEKLLSERIFMNKPKILNTDDEISIEQAPSTHKDSLNFRLNIPDAEEDFFVSSISVYPKESISHYPNDNLASAVYLHPYLQDPVNHKGFYFDQDNNKTSYFLDMLLINQDGSPYNYQEIFNENHNFTSLYENGMKFKFRLQSRIRNKDKYLLFYPGPYQDDKLLKIKDQFIIKKQYRVKNEMMRFSIVNKKQKFRAPKFNMSNLYEFPETDAPDYHEISPLNKKNYELKARQSKFITSFQDAEQLEEVVVFGEKEKEDETEEFNDEFGRVYEITKDKAERYMYLSDYLISKGLQVRENVGTDQSISITFPRNRNIGEVTIFLNDVPIGDNAVIYKTFLSDYRAVILNKTGFGLGMRGQGGAIKLYTRKEALDYATDNSKWSKRRHTNTSVYQVKKGYSYPDPFNISEYLLFNKTAFEKTGTLAWIPIYNSKDNEKYFQVYKAGFDQLCFYLQGITANGAIINRKVVKDITTD